jgi:hypothetical protein
LAITNGYCTLADVKAALRIPNADTIDDTILEGNVEAASRFTTLELLSGILHRAAAFTALLMTLSALAR